MCIVFPLQQPFFFFRIRPPPTSTLFPYTTLFRSMLLTTPVLLATQTPVIKDIRFGRHLTFDRMVIDRKSTRLNSSHPSISYAVFCLKKKTLIEPVTVSQHTVFTIY